MPTDSEILRRQQRRPGFRTVPPNDWRPLLRARLNVLVAGPEAALMAFVDLARKELREPIRFGGVPLPPFEERVGTLILADVDALEEADQQRLVRWMDAQQHAGIQVISLTSRPLYSSVIAGQFDAELYYRLNMICLEIQAV